MDETRLQSISQLQAFLAGTVEVRFCVPDNDEARYAHIVSVAQRFGYARLICPLDSASLRLIPELENTLQAVAARQIGG